MTCGSLLWTNFLKHTNTATVCIIFAILLKNGCEEVIKLLAVFSRSNIWVHLPDYQLRVCYAI